MLLSTGCCGRLSNESAPRGRRVHNGIPGGVTRWRRLPRHLPGPRDLESSIGPSQTHQGREIAEVRCAERLEVSVAGFAAHLEVNAAPGKRRAAQVLDQPIGAEPRVSAIAVWERVDANELVVKIHR